MDHESTLVETAGDKVEVFDDLRNISLMDMELRNRFLAQLNLSSIKAGAGGRKEEKSYEVSTSIMVGDSTASTAVSKLLLWSRYLMLLLLLLLLPVTYYYSG